MKRTIGPLDKRKKVTRCQSCAKRRIKCEGGYPCEYCIRTGKTCQLQRLEPTGVKFVICAEPEPSFQVAEIPMQVGTYGDITYLEHFASFLQRSHFTREFASVSTDLISLVETSPSLRYIAVAIGALEASRRGSARSLLARQSPRYIAFGSYGSSLEALQSQISTGDAAHREGALWTTFLLGQFELITGTSGNEWAKHMVFGTSVILQMLGPTHEFSSRQQKLFDAFRLLETNRAILYGEPTFLSQGVWSEYQQSVALKKNNSSDPMETILALMMQVSSFSQRFFDQVESIPKHLRSLHPALDTISVRGTKLQDCISNWQSEMMLDLDPADPFSQLAVTNYHALQLFHCRNFTFYSCWMDRAIPWLCRYEIDQHVNGILEQSEQLLRASNIPGVILLFPLRMAGVYASECHKREKVLNILKQIHQKGFIVSDRIKTDLQELWHFETLSAAHSARNYLN